MSDDEQCEQASDSGDSQATEIQEDSDDDTIVTLSEGEDNYADEGKDNYFISRDDSKWYTKVFPKRQAFSHNVLHNSPGLNN